MGIYLLKAAKSVADKQAAIGDKIVDFIWVCKGFITCENSG
jgi:hypothetical protein